MNMTGWIGATILGLCAPASVARADHHDTMAPAGGAPTSGWTASVAVVAASFSMRSYIGAYQGVLPSATWAAGRYAIAASLPGYRLDENGQQTYGLGDAVVGGQASWRRDRPTSFGVSLAVSAPSGDPQRGYGMGHLMVMPAVFGSWTFANVTLISWGWASRGPP